MAVQLVRHLVPVGPRGACNMPHTLCTSNLKSHTDPNTIRGFTIAFFRSLFGEGNFTADQVSSCVDCLRTNKNSGLFHGYAWELEVNGKVYFKS